MILLYINGESVYTEGLRIQWALTSQPDSAQFTLKNPASVPFPGQSVYIYRDSTDLPIFGGSVVSVTKMPLGVSVTPELRTFQYQVFVQDFSRQLDRYLVNAAYDDMTCKDIIEDIVANFTDAAIGFTTTGVETGPVVARIVFNYESVSDSIRDLANLVGYEWFVRHDKNIQFFAADSTPAPFVINDACFTSDENNINSFQIQPDYTQVRNRVYVRGGYYLSSDYTHVFTADGVSRAFPLPHKPHDVSVLTIGGVTKTFAVDYLNADDGTYQYFWSYGESYLRVADGGSEPTPGSGVEISITYKFEVPIIVRADNLLSQLAIGALEGGDGIYEAIIKDDTIDSRDTAQNRARIEVERFGDANITGSFNTYEHGFLPGQQLTLQAIGGFEAYSSTYTIQTVTAVLVGNNLVQYRVVFGSSIYKLTDFLLGLKRNADRVSLRADETVDVLKLITETTEFEDAIAITSNVHPSIWGEFTWGLFTWG